MCCHFPYNFRLQHLYPTKNSARCYPYVQMFLCKVPVILVKTLITMNFSRDFVKMFKYQISSKSIHQVPVVMCWGTDGHMTNLTVAFCNFAKVPKVPGNVSTVTKKCTNGLKCTPYERRIKIIIFNSNKSWDIYLTNKKHNILIKTKTSIKSQSEDHKKLITSNSI
jgi:hypothetical protein